MADSGNNTQSAFVHSSGIRLDTIPAIIMMVAILLINGGVVLLICCFSSLRTTSNLILCSLAVSDFLLGFLGIPLVVACSATFLTPVCLSANTFFTFMSKSTVLHITAMTCDRYIYINWAMRYRHIVNRFRVMTVLVFIWLISLSSLIRLSWTLHVNTHNAAEDLGLVKEEETTYLLFNLIVFFGVLLIVMVALDARMLLLIRKQRRRISQENLPADFLRHEKKKQRRKRRAVLTCVLLLCLYVLFWLPYFILELVLQDPRIPEFVITTIYYLRLCPSLFNPVAYTLRKLDLRRKAKYILYKIFTCRPLKGMSQRPFKQVQSSLAHV